MLARIPEVNDRLALIDKIELAIQRIRGMDPLLLASLVVQLDELRAMGG